MKKRQNSFKVSNNEATKKSRDSLQNNKVRFFHGFVVAQFRVVSWSRFYNNSNSNPRFAGCSRL